MRQAGARPILRRSRNPSFATTGLGEDADVLHTCLAGFAGHRVKPIMPEMVGTLLDKVLPARPPRDSSV